MRVNDYSIGRSLERSVVIVEEMDEGFLGSVVIPLESISQERVDQLVESLILDVRGNEGIVRVLDNRQVPIVFKSKISARSASEDLKASLYKKVALYFAHNFDTLIVMPDKSLISITIL